MIKNNKIKTVENLPGEEWKVIEDFPMYSVSNQNRVKRNAYEFWFAANNNLTFRPETLLKQHKSKDGYWTVTLVHGKDKKRQTKRVHRLMMLSFVKNPDPAIYTFVNHKNENKGDNRLENLEWAKPVENANYGTRNQRIAKAARNKTLTVEHRKNLSKALTGNKNRSGRKNTIEHNQAISKYHSKAVITDDMSFKNIKQAAEYYKVNYRTMAHYLQGDRQMPDRLKSIHLRFAETENNNENKSAAENI